MKHIALLLAPLALTACLETTAISSGGGGTSGAPLSAPMSVELGGATSAAGTTVLQAQDAAALTGPAYVGTATTVASVGDPVEPGLWMRTPLVSEPTRARVQVIASGLSVILQLLPSEGAEGSGSQLSLDAMRALQLSLTDLTEVQISAPI